jgi:hypothetical protein
MAGMRALRGEKHPPLWAAALDVCSSRPMDT